jgi:uncharacterized pyridoxamine 5'-phosphate oxidase family protein
MEQKNLDIYGQPPIPWSRAQELLDANDASTWWLATVRPDGRPHLTGVGAFWADGKLYFVTGSGTRKGRNLAEDPSCVLSAGLKGIDLVIEGTARRVTDQATLERMAKKFAAGGWPATVSDRALTAPSMAPSAGPPPWDLYVLDAKTAFGVASAEPNGAMRWRF